MVYFDTSATSLERPPAVALATAQAINSLGNAGRSFYAPSIEAAQTILQARCEIAALTELESPLHVAFTSSATEALNLVLRGLLNKTDSVITTGLEHNSVLRPLYQIGCNIQFIPFAENGQLDFSSLNTLLKPNTKALVCTHGSNVIGSTLSLTLLKDFCSKHGIVFVCDVAQTLGHIPVSASWADILCFAGHKGLFGPQGTGGVIAKELPKINVVKTGGTGYDTFAKIQPTTMPDIFEAGTTNSHSLSGLAQGVEFINTTGIENMAKKEKQLAQQFLQGIAKIPNLKLYGTPFAENQLPVISLNLGQLTSDELAFLLWDTYEIATRPGFHCAPLVHQHFGTENRGMVRFSFGYYNTPQEIEFAVDALAAIANGT